MIKAILIYDEPKNIRILSALLSDYCPQVQITGKAENHNQAIE